MNAKQWNATMFSALAALVIIAVPFLAVASDIDFGGFLDIDAGGFTDIDFGGFSDIDAGGFTDIDFGGQSDIDFGGAAVGAGVETGIPGFDPFDDDFGPFDNIPGNPSGDDIVIPQPHPEEPPVIPPPVVPPVEPTPQPSPSPESKDYLRIFIHNIFMNNPFDEQPGDQVALRITFENTGTKKLENTKVIVGIPDLAVKASFGPLDLGKGEKATATAYLELPEDTMPGVYPVRIQIYNENSQRIVHREIEVVDYS
ncbi:MAG: NEW3 domain-containing protein [Candidatus Woesearchaeota archaeon]